MAENLGKKFEDRVREQLARVDGVSIDRLHDQMSGLKGSTNICDLIVYKEPYEYYFELKSVHGNTLPFSNITETQWNGLLAKSKIEGVFAGVLCWWIDKDVTKFIPIRLLNHMKLLGWKSIRFDDKRIGTLAYPQQCVELTGKKKRVFFEYDWEKFFNGFRRDCI